MFGIYIVATFVHSISRNFKDIYYDKAFRNEDEAKKYYNDEMDKLIKEYELDDEINIKDGRNSDVYDDYSPKKNVVIRCHLFRG